MDEATEELYGLDPADFVAARNELVRRLRKAGDRERAAEVAKLRRPSPPAWAVNQLVRRHRDDVEELVRLGEALRAAQDRALAGEEPGDLRTAGRARRDALARLVDQADRILVERGAAPGAHAGEIAATLEAASLDAESAEAVLVGRLTTELQPPSGFGAFDPSAAAPPRPRAAADAPAPTKRDSRELREAQEEAAEAKRRWEERSDEARTAVARVADQRQAAQDAEAEVARLEDLLEAAPRRLRRAVREAEQAEDAAAQAEETAARAAQRLRKAEQRLAQVAEAEA